MLYHILSGLMVFIFLFGVGAVVSGRDPLVEFLLNVSLIVVLLCFSSNYNSNLSHLETNHLKVSALQERLNSLNSRLAEFPYPQGALVKLDHDSPVRSITGAIVEAEEQLVKAKSDYVDSLASVKSTQRGFMSGVTYWFGSWDEETKTVVRD